VTVSTLEALYRTYERLTDLHVALAHLRVKTTHAAQDKQAVLNRLQTAREAVRRMTLTGRVDQATLQGIYQGVVGLTFRWEGPSVQAAISSLRTALCRSR
jgi:hypothetical protein